MSKPAINLSCIVIALVILSLSGCAGGNRGQLNRVRQPTETELKQDWQNYTVYYRRNLALIYKIKNDRKIILDKRWVEVTSEDMMVQSRILDHTWVKEIVGNDGEMFGYLVHRHNDDPSVKIIDHKTVKLSYNHNWGPN